ncbi:hypothetical protein ACOMHN_002913 [Nucella lapillus]
MASASRLKAGWSFLSAAQSYLTAPTTRVCSTCQHSHYRQFSKSASAAGVFEPDDLKLEPDIPEYSSLNIRMRGYDFVPLESYAKFVHCEAIRLDLDTSAWAVPARCYDVKTFKPNSTVVDNMYGLKMYERTVQIDNVPSPILPILLEKIRTHVAECIYVTVKELDPEEEGFRYIPDKEMKDLKTQMKTIDNAREERRKK